ncbi:glycosyltransferase family 4 protein [Candidatus Parcubacteria bacterium]|nr:glycosyltransferase family 4 protein [Patescibacteria group bacterium]MBU4380820.1 glycosyltransferase family 4 protein [Patescibacteria group bacterium]MCG2689485.1 glycosyltransferase family 4 protein [Candidatus Parcubacteria bacterium]
MNICIFSTTFFPNTGGGERFIHGLGTHLSESQTVFVLVPFDQKMLVNFKPNYSILRLRFINPFLQHKRLLEAILLLNLSYYHLKYRFNLVQAVVLYEPGFVAGIFGKIFNVPVILRPTGEDIQFDKSISYGRISNPFYKSRVTQALNLATKIVAISPTVKKTIMEFTNGKLKEKIVGISNGVDLEKFKIGEIGVTKKIGEIRLLTVGRNVPKKDYPTMLKALAVVVKEFPQAHLDIVGGNEGGLTPIISQLGITNNVTLLGKLPKDRGDFLQYPPQEVLDLYNKADLFVFSSLIEGCPNVILEAISAKLPIVAANSPGTWDYVKDLQTGLLFKPGNFVDMANKIIKLIKDKDLYCKIQEYQKKYSQEFDWSEIAQRYLKLYNNIT